MAKAQHGDEEASKAAKAAKGSGAAGYVTTHVTMIRKGQIEPLFPNMHAAAQGAAQADICNSDG